MHKSVANLVLIKDQIKSKFGLKKKLNIIAVSKTFSIIKINPLIEYGHIHFGENKVQEALEKWTIIKNLNQNIKLHMIGKLQTNKVKYVVPLFDYIHSLDSIKLAQKISIEQNKINKKLKIFIQVNLGNENQKSGIDKKDLSLFYERCVRELNLDIVGLMCIPPNISETKLYFQELAELNYSLKLQDLSMGMSSDYMDAIECGATFLRIGSNIFGNRF